MEDDIKRILQDKQFLRENYDYRNVSWEMICIYDLTLSKMRGRNVTHALSKACG
jgi:hypothetical protein